jgi:hypothetical protein
MATSKDSFSVDIVLRHPSHNPESISEALSLRPKASWRVGENLGRANAKWSFFYARLLEGSAPSDYERALKNVRRFLRKNAAFWTDFAGGNGEVELILNHNVNPQNKEGDECFELYLAPAFLQELSTRDIGLRIQGWQGTIKPDRPAYNAKRAAGWLRKR